MSNRLAAGLGLVVLAGVLAVSAPSQVFTFGTGTTINTTTTYPAPYGNWYWGSRHQFMITAAEMAAAGMVPGPITAVAFDVVTVAGQALQNFTIKMGQTTAIDVSAWQPANNLVFGPVTYTATAGWNTHAFCGSESWDGTSNLVIETCQQNGSFTNNCVFNQTATGFVSSRWYRADAQGVCGNAGQTGTMSQRPNIQLTQSAPPPVDYQVNQTGCNLLLNGAPGSACFPTVVNQSVYVCTPVTPVTGSLVLSTTNIGLPWDIAVASANLVPASGGGITLPDGQIVNLNFAAPIVFLNNFLASSFPGIGIPGVNTGSLSLGYSLAATTDLSVQAICIDVSSATGVRLSQATELHVALLPPPSSVAGPIADSAFTTVSIATQPNCWTTAGIPFFGVNYTQLHVSSNGRVNFVTGNTSGIPTVASALTSTPMVGLWTDLNPALGGTITITNPGTGIVRVNYNGVPYAGEAATSNSFAIIFDSLTGAVTLDGLTGIATNPQTVLGTGDAQFLGISRGNTGATNLGASTTFTAGGGGLASNATHMWYDFYTQVAGGAGKAASLVPGTLNSITFLPAGGAMAPNYDWSGS